MNIYCRMALIYALAAAGTPASADSFVYVAAAKDGTIDAYRMDATTGTLDGRTTVAVGTGVAPMAVSPDRRHLYAAIRTQPYRVVTLARDGASGALSEDAVAALPDSLPYIALDPTGRMLLGASYGGHTVTLLPVAEDGRVTSGARQLLPAGRNAHAIITDAAGRFAFSTALGTDEVVSYRLVDGLLDPIGSITTGTGSGPRHMVMAPDGRHLFVLTELSGEVVAFAVDSDTGILSEAARASILPGDSTLQRGLPPTAKKDDVARIWAADLAITPDGRFLYATERTTSRVSILRVDGADMALMGGVETEPQPRGIALDADGRYLIASGERSDHIAVYAISAQDGALTSVGRYPVGAGANWITVVPVD